MSSDAGAAPTEAPAHGGSALPRFLSRPSPRDPAPVTDPAERRGLRWETVLVLGVSLGSSAVYAVLSIIDSASRTAASSSTMNTVEVASALTARPAT